MPTNRRKIVRTGKIEVTDDQKYHLLKGFTLLSVCEPFFGKMGYPFENERTRQAVWRKCRAELMQEVGPNRRPHAWWNYESKERRRIIGGDASLAMWGKGEFFGKCKVYNIESWKDPRRPIFESQADYLKRHGRVIRFKK